MLERPSFRLNAFHLSEGQSVTIGNVDLQNCQSWAPWKRRNYFVELSCRTHNSTWLLETLFWGWSNLVYKFQGWTCDFPKVSLYKEVPIPYPLTSLVSGGSSHVAARVLTLGMPPRPTCVGFLRASMGFFPNCVGILLACAGCLPMCVQPPSWVLVPLVGLTKKRKRKHPIPAHLCFFLVEQDSLPTELWRPIW